MLKIKKIEIRREVTANVTILMPEMRKIAGGELPDIDGDYEGGRRDEVKDYLKLKYGEDYFSSVGTYGNYKLKQAFADLCSYLGISFSDKNFYSKMIDKEFSSADLSEVIRLLVNKEPKLKQIFVKKYPKFPTALYLSITNSF